MITDYLPQRPPFLFVDKIVEKDNNQIKTATLFHEDYDFFNGHFPGEPIVPGVILCEMAFQTGAILLHTEGEEEIGVVTKIEHARFKQLVRPNDEVVCHLRLDDHLGANYKLVGKLMVRQKVVLSIHFSCSRISKSAK